MLNLKPIIPVVFILLCNASQAKSIDAAPSPAPDADTSTVTEPRVKEGNKTRGQLLYETHCIACHESGLHIRARRKARDIADINQYVTRWVSYQKLDWGIDEIQQVANYLNRQFYHYEE